MNDRVLNIIYKFLDLYAGDGYWCKCGKVRANENYTITFSSYLMTNNGTVIFECLGSGHIITDVDLIEILSRFFKVDFNLSREIIIEWFLKTNNLVVDDVRDMFKKVI